jgi:hypothetical protein
MKNRFRESFDEAVRVVAKRDLRALFLRDAIQHPRCSRAQRAWRRAIVEDVVDGLATPVCSIRASQPRELHALAMRSCLYSFVAESTLTAISDNRSAHVEQDVEARSSAQLSLPFDSPTMRDRAVLEHVVVDDRLGRLPGDAPRAATGKPCAGLCHAAGLSLPVASARIFLITALGLSS